MPEIITNRYTLPGVKKVVIFGASFNPPTTSHAAFIKLLLRTSEGFDTVCVIPAGQSPMKHLEIYATAEDRLAMLRLLIHSSIPREQVAKLRIETIELENPPPSRMVETLLQLIMNHRGQEAYTLACGYDHLAHFDRWYRWEAFKDLCTLKFYPRQGIHLCQKQTVNTLQKLLRAGIHVVIVFLNESERLAFCTYCFGAEHPRNIPRLELVCDEQAFIERSASSDIRGYYQRYFHHDVSETVPAGMLPEVHQYIVEHRCYP